MYGAIRKEYTTLGSGFHGMAEVFGKAGDGDSIKLSMAIAETGKAMDDIGQLWKTEAPNSEIPFMEHLNEYSSMLTQFNESVTASKEADKKKLEVQDPIKAVPAPEREIA